jgi:hypothetical protein
MKINISPIILAFLIIVGMTGCNEATGGTPSAAPVRIGLYDSRSIAIAYAGTKYFDQAMSALQEEYKQALANGDQAVIDEIEARAEEQQAQMHLQAFSTAPVDEILAQIKELLPGIMQQANVSMLVSKWDQETLDGYPDAELVDVTLLLVDALEPSEQQRNYAIEIQEQEPIPLEEAENIDD